MHKNTYAKGPLTALHQTSGFWLDLGRERSGERTGVKGAGEEKGCGRELKVPSKNSGHVRPCTLNSLSVLCTPMFEVKSSQVAFHRPKQVSIAPVSHKMI